MEAANLALERARKTESALATLRAELADLELGEALGAPAREPLHDDLGTLGTSIDDLARLHEGHASNMREFGRVLRDDRMPPPIPSEEPDFALTGRRAGGGGGGSAASSSALAAAGPRPNFSRPLAGGSSSAEGPPRGISSSLDTAPMQRSATATREAAAQARARSEAAQAARFASEAAARRDAAARQDAVRQRMAARAGGALDAERAAMAEAAASGGAQTARAYYPGAPAAAASSSAIPAAPSSRSQQNLAASASGSALPVRIPRPARPSSAPRERRSITVPTPFSFEHRPKRDNAALRKMQAEIELERAELEESRQEALKPQPVPSTNAPGLYMKQVEEMEARSRERRTVRRTVPQPFSFTNRPPSARKSWDAAVGGGGAPLADSGTPRGVPPAADPAAYLEVGERKAFKARDVPRSMSEPRWEMMRVREAERREKVAHEAIKLAGKSRLPPRMQQHKETERARKAADSERVQAELDAELTLKPRITEGIPDFDRLHLGFEQAQARKRASYRPTVPTPFKMESEPYKAMASENRKVKEEMIKRDMRRDELVMPERRWPYLSTQAPVGRANPPDSGLSTAQVPHFETTRAHKVRVDQRLKEAKENDAKSKAKK